MHWNHSLRELDQCFRARKKENPFSFSRSQIAVKMHVASEDFIRSLASEYYFKTALADSATQQVFGNTMSVYT